MAIGELIVKLYKGKGRTRFIRMALSITAVSLTIIGEMNAL